MLSIILAKDLELRLLCDISNKIIIVRKSLLRIFKKLASQNKVELSDSFHTIHYVDVKRLFAASLISHLALKGHAGSQLPVNLSG